MSKKAVIKRDGKWIVRGLNTGRTLGRHSTKKAADRQLRAIEWSMHGEKRARGRGRRHRRGRHRIFKL